MVKQVSGKNLFDFDKTFNKTIIGTDEAGRGSAAGGVFASAVYFNNITAELHENLFFLNDSKQLSPSKREYLFDFIQNETINSTVCINVEDIEKYNILNCSLLAMRQACNNVMSQIDFEDILVLVDGNKLIKDFNYPQQCIIKGDCKSASIAAASILAKVNRDRYMKELGKDFAVYAWDKNAGYLTKEHLRAIDEYGLTVHHRKSFLQKHFKKQLKLF